MTYEELEVIEARCNAATPGPWEWDVNSVSKIVHLRTAHSGRYYVMGFKRFGTKGAAPTFQVYLHYSDDNDDELERCEDCKKKGRIQ